MLSSIQTGLYFGKEHFSETDPCVQKWCTISGMDTLGKRIKAERKRAGLSQTQLATAVGVKQQSISHLERDKAEDTKLILPIATVLKVNPYWLETGKGPKEAKSWNLLLDMDGLDAELQTVAREAIEAVKKDELSGDQLAAMLRALLMSRKKLDPVPSGATR
jgi:transcriptional regulator with XRE-family HTH domain